MNRKKNIFKDFALEMLGDRFWVDCIYCHRVFVCRDPNLKRFIGRKGYVVCKYCSSQK